MKIVHGTRVKQMRVWEKEGKSNITILRYLQQKGSMRPKLSHNTAKMSFVLFAFKFILKFGLMMLKSNEGNGEGKMLVLKVRHS